MKDNTLKQALAQNRRQIGLWSSLASNLTAEIIAGSGFDWILFDVEHSPNDLRTILMQLQAAAPWQVEPIVRPPHADPILIKQYLDIGVRSLLLPNINSAAEAQAMVAATRYPPLGMRGISVASRANHFGRIANYHQRADDQICLILQIESPAAVDAAEAIAATPGVDAIFVGPSDLSATMGHMLQPGMPVVQDAIVTALEAARRAGKAAGILAPVEADARRYLELGYTMVGVGSDQGLLVKASDALARKFKTE